jgi:hypothetical protein
MYFVVVIEFLYIDYTTKSLKNPSFQIKKALQQKTKGLKCLGSPCWTASELLKGI